MLIVKNGQGELVAKSATRAAEVASTAAPAAIGVFHGLEAAKGRHAVFVPDPDSDGGGGGGAAAAAPHTVPLTENDDGIALLVVTVPTSTTVVLSPGATLRFHSPALTLTSEPTCSTTPFHAPSTD